MSGHELEKYVRRLEDRIEALESSEYVIVVCRQRMGMNGRTWDVLSINEGMYVDASTWPKESDACFEEPLWLGLAKVWCTSERWHANAATPSGKVAGVVNQKSREDALNELNWAIERVERDKA